MAKIQLEEKNDIWFNRAEFYFALFSRTIVYIGVLYLGYIFLPIQKIGSIPLGKLTLSDILLNVFIIIICVFIIRKFFEFPEKDDKDKIELWSALGGLIILTGIIIILRR